MNATNLLLTGRPGVGKTTLIQRVVECLEQPVGGFYTRELRKGGRRVGFEIVTLAGEVAVLAHVEIRSRHRVGRYGVDVAALDRVGVPAVQAAVREGWLVVIDEIGKMELFSDAFRKAALEALNSPAPVLASITRGHHPWARRIKERPDVEIVEVTARNRDLLVQHLARRLTA